MQAHRATVSRLTETGLRLSDGIALDADVVIACTGYRLALPYLPADVLAGAGAPTAVDDPPTLGPWKLVVPLRYSGLFVISLFEGPGPATVPSEMAARLAAAVVSGRVALPPAAQMECDVRA